VLLHLARSELGIGGGSVPASRSAAATRARDAASALRVLAQIMARSPVARKLFVQADLPALESLLAPTRLLPLHQAASSVAHGTPADASADAAATLAVSSAVNEVASCAIGVLLGLLPEARFILAGDRQATLSNADADASAAVRAVLLRCTPLVDAICLGAVQEMDPSLHQASEASESESASMFRRAACLAALGSAALRSPRLQLNLGLKAIPSALAAAIVRKSQSDLEATARQF